MPRRVRNLRNVMDPKDDPYIVKESPSAKRTIQQHEEDLVFIAERYLKGLTVEQITGELNDARLGSYSLSKWTISVDIDIIHKRWITSYLVDFDKAKARELAHIDMLELEYWNAWRTSQKKIEEIESEKIEDKQGGQRVTLPSYERTRVKKIEKMRDGNNEFLRGIQWCIDQRCKILGLTMNISQSTINVNWRKEAEASGVDPDGALNDLIEQFVTAATVGGESGGRSLGSGTEDNQGSEPNS